jgi:hypothetical protein
MAAYGARDEKNLAETDSTNCYGAVATQLELYRLPRPQTVTHCAAGDMLVERVNASRMTENSAHKKKAPAREALELPKIPLREEQNSVLATVNARKVCSVQHGAVLR